MLRLWDKTVIKEIKNKARNKLHNWQRVSGRKAKKIKKIKKKECVCLLAGSISADCLSTCTAVIKSSSHLAVERERECRNQEQYCLRGAERSNTHSNSKHISAPPPQLSYLPHSQGKLFFFPSVPLSFALYIQCTVQTEKKVQWTAWLHEFMPAVTFTV